MKSFKEFLAEGLFSKTMNFLKNKNKEDEKYSSAPKRTPYVYKAGKLNLGKYDSGLRLSINPDEQRPKVKPKSGPEPTYKKYQFHN